MTLKLLIYLLFSGFRLIYGLPNFERIEPIEAKVKKQKVCAYARVSTDSIEQGKSFKNQVITYEKLIKSNPEYEFVGVYADHGISRTNENRPEFQRMVADCKAGKIDLIVTKSISRFARNTTIVLNYTRKLKQLGIGGYFEENNINTLSTEEELVVTVLDSFAQEESRNISKNNKWSIQKRFERGEVMIRMRLVTWLSTKQKPRLLEEYLKCTFLVKGVIELRRF